jgi:GntR family transcriptional regulator
VLNTDSGLPLYQQLAERLAHAIEHGDYAVGARLPSEHALAGRYKIGRPTVRQATELLVRRGILQRRRGAGTFVVEPPVALDVFSMAGTLAAFREQGVRVRTRLLRPVTTREVAAGEDNPLAGRRAHVLSRLSLTEQGAVLLEDSYLDAELFGALPALPRGGGSLSRLVREHYGLSPSGGRQELSVALVSGARARALELDDGAPVLLARRFIDFARGKSAIYAELYHRTDRVVLCQRIGDRT